MPFLQIQVLHTHGRATAEPSPMQILPTQYSFQVELAPTPSTLPLVVQVVQVQLPKPSRLTEQCSTYQATVLSVLEEPSSLLLRQERIATLGQGRMVLAQAKPT